MLRRLGSRQDRRADHLPHAAVDEVRVERVEQLLHEASVFLPARVFTDLLATIRAELPGAPSRQIASRRDLGSQPVAAYLRPIRRLILHGEDGEGALAARHLKVVEAVIDTFEVRGRQPSHLTPSA